MHTPSVARPGESRPGGRGETNATPAGAPARLMTATEHAACRAEIRRLREIREEDLPDLLRAARTFVASDAAEEIAQILEDLAYVDARIAQLERLLLDAQVVDGGDGSGLVAVGRTVEVEYVRSGKVMVLRVAGIGMTRDGTPTVTAASPVGRALMGHGPGAVVSVEMPDGSVEELRIVSVSTGHHERAA